MANERGGFDPGLMQDNLAALADNPYPGRGIIMGVSEGGEQAVQAYWVMGRSENSRNRVLLEERGTVKTDAFDPSKVEDPSLIIYKAMLTVPGLHESYVVSNGDQTETVRDALLDTSPRTKSTVHSVFRDALLSREFEPDPPNYTPRITGTIFGGNESYDYSIIRRNQTTGEAEHTFGGGSLREIPAGAGICFHTYEWDAPSKSEPIPAFEGSPYAVPLAGSAEEIAEALWPDLNEENKVALAVKTINRRTGRIVIQLVNKLTDQEAA